MNIAFIGPYGCGKTTLAQALVDNQNFLRMSFAGPVKADCAKMLDYMAAAFGERLAEDYHKRITVGDIERHKRDVFGPLLQWYGTDFWREYMGEPDHWIRRFTETYQKLPPTVNVVVDDCRFLNEADALRDLGFTIIRIDNSSPRVSDDARARTHASEQEWQRIVPDLVFTYTTWQLHELPRVASLLTDREQWKGSPYVSILRQTAEANV